jgi:trimethylamine---corrinoid protein Co-methyltransferase
MTPLDVSDDALAFDAIAEVAPGGHYFGAAHTMSRFEHAFHRPMISDIRPFQTWVESGSPNATQRAHVMWKRLLENYQQPPLDPGRAEEMEAFITRRRAEIGAKGLA